MVQAFRPVSILIAALGGEGGGVLCEWLVQAATRAGHPVQGTSIPGVAQRTGATTYYAEISPLGHAELGGRRPIFSLTPVPGRVDLVVTSELLETARVLQAGHVDPDGTTLIASAARTLTTVEKMAMGDGRLDADRLQDAARQFAARFVCFDMQALAQREQTLVSAVMLGALAASGKLPFAPAHCEAAIEASGKGVAASLAGFRAGYAEVVRQLAPVPGEAGVTPTPTPLPGSAHRAHGAPLAPRLVLALERFEDPAREILEPAVARLVQYQDLRYAELYIARVDTLAALARRSGASPAEGTQLLREGARFLALWMLFDDIVRVADLKTRRSRFERVRREVAAGPGDIVHIADYFKPRLEELMGLFPEALATAALHWLSGRRWRRGFALALRVDSVAGFLMLRALASLRALRRHGLRYAQEQRRIEQWLAALGRLAPLGYAPVYELALCARLVKGYGDTNARAHENLARILETLAGPEVLAHWTDASTLAAAIRSAREAALSDPDGKALDRDIARHGAMPRPLPEHPITFIKPVRA
jgi:indolepyruvate ferredoxin oxidoreductase beta subunit